MKKIDDKIFYITDDASNIVRLEHIVGKIDLLNNDKGKAVSKLLQSGNFVLSPYGYGERNEDGTVTNFNLIGFNITAKK